VIPHRVKLSGFLSYKDEQIIHFDGSQLWMLSGLNGSGKSTIFDGITYALFGHHRGGAQQASELINKDSNSLTVEFDYRIDQQLYQIRRTLKRSNKGGATGTQQILQWTADPFGGEGRWQPVPDTNKKVDFENWIREKIGLTYETFTSSVLLLQGRAEKLLDSKPSGRAEVLASIVDLERYQKLHEKADHQRRSFKAQLEAIQNQISGIPDITEMELFAAEQKIESAEEAKTNTTVEVDRLQTIEFESRKWIEHQNRLQGLRAKWKEADTFIQESAQIEKSFERLKELKEVIPQINNIQVQVSGLEASKRKTEKWENNRRAIQESQTATEHTLEMVKKKRLALQKTQSSDEDRLSKVTERLRSMAGLLSQVQMFESLQTKLAELEKEINRLGDHPEQKVQEITLLHDQRIELSQIVPALQRFVHLRQELQQATSKQIQASKEENQIRLKGEELKKEVERLQTEFNTKSHLRQSVAQSATETRTIYTQAELAVKEFDQLEGKKVCRYCGQPLTPKHYAEEKARRIKDFELATKNHREQTKQFALAEKNEQFAQTEFQKQEEKLRTLRDEYRDRKKELELSAKEIDRLKNDGRQVYLSLPDDYRKQIGDPTPSDWVATQYPSLEQLSILTNQVNELDVIRKRLSEAQKKFNQWTRLQGELESTTQGLNKLKKEFPGSDWKSVREDHTSFSAEEKSIQNAIKATKKLLQENEMDIDRLNKGLTEIQQQLSEVNGNLQSEEAVRIQLQDSIERSRKLLPENWRQKAAETGLAEQLRWKEELDNLLQKRVEEKYQKLGTFRANLENLKQDIAEAERIESEFPTESRTSPDVIAKQLMEAKKMVKLRDSELQTAKQEKAILDRHREQRQQLLFQTLSVEKEHNFYRLLGELLGRDRLQRHLVRQAERQIVDYANSVLDRLSGGELCLRLCTVEDGSDRALDLEAYNRATGGSAINVAFLSGSQRFRVAVSLALGIGQYASRQHRPIESVIIDEGFGCLDRQGRQVMIQELQNLRGHLHCILLVSHQEEFADAFPDGYRFELQDGATRVRRLQR
jgi:DNA repair protein SbcC/Rad50